MTESKPKRWRPPQTARAEMMARGRIISDRLYAEAVASLDRLDAIEAEFPDAGTAGAGGRAGKQEIPPR